MTSNLLTVHFLSAIRTDSRDPYIYFNFKPHDPCVYDWLQEVCPKILITNAAAALVDHCLLSREQMLLHIESAAKPGLISFDAHFKPGDPTGVQLLTMLILGGHVDPMALRAIRTGSEYTREWLALNDLTELMLAQLELMGGDE